MTSEYSGPVRIGAVGYLNSKPLIEELSDLAPEAELRLDYPSRLADNLAGGELDVALIPTIELFQDEDYEVVSDACVAARGPVLSVKLYCRVPAGDIGRLALDAGSRTSAALSRIMLSERFGVQPEIEELPLGASTSDTDADAVLLIGDRGMDAPSESFEERWDLGEEWFRWTGLPFVFAVWAKRRDVELGRVEEALSEARDLGCSRLDEIAERESALLGVSHKAAIDYLTNNLHYRLGSAERNGLKLFHQLAVRKGLAREGGSVVFRDRAATG